MNFNYKKYLCILIMALLISFLFTGCLENSSNESEEKIGTVTMSIKGYNDLANYKQTEISITEGTTVLDALYESGLTIDASEGFVTSIDGLKNGSVKDYPYCGWIFYINGEFAEKGASECVLKDGDEIEWVFSLTFD